jgi:hypothetical protein
VSWAWTGTLVSTKIGAIVQILPPSSHASLLRQLRTSTREVASLGALVRDAATHVLIEELAEEAASIVD